MFCIYDKQKQSPVKSGFKTSSQANDWAKKHLPQNEVHLWGKELKFGCRYFVKKSQ